MRNDQSKSFFLILTLLASATIACSLFTPGGIDFPGGQEGGQGTLFGRSTPGVKDPQGGYSDITEGLEDLQSYRASLTISLNGQGQDGSPQPGRMEMLHELNRTRQQEHLLYDFTGSFQLENQADGAGRFESFSRDQKTYLLSEIKEGSGCTAVPEGEGDLSSSTIYSIMDLIAGIQNPRLEKSGELVNGVMTDRYSFKGAAFYFGAQQDFKGKYWMAAGDNYVVRLTGEGTGQGGDNGAPVTGVTTLEYNLTDINADFDLPLPAECAGAAPPADVPIPEGATAFESYTDLITFQTSLSPAEAADFYRSQMPPNGWTAGEEKTVGQMVILPFSRESRLLTVSISADASGTTSVLISPSNP